MICHGIPDQRPLQDGDIVNVDVTAYYKGYHGDLNETFVVGTVDEESKNLIKVTAEVWQGEKTGYYIAVSGGGLFGGI